jgi:hypothetical protein
MVANDTQRSGRIAKRRNLLRRTLDHGWFSITSVCAPAGVDTGEGLRIE